MTQREESQIFQDNEQKKQQCCCAPRACTDEFCCVIFAFFVAGMVWIMYYAQSPSLGNGDIRKLVHGFDWEGNICDVSDAPSVQGRPFLYWCATQDPGHVLQISDGICVRECPTSDTTSNLCPGSPRITRQSVSMSDGTGGSTVTVSVARDLVKLNDHPTIEILGMYCLPESDEMMNAILDHAGMNNYRTSVYAAMHGMIESKNLLIGVAIISVFAGYAFLGFMKHFAGPFIKILFGISILGSFVISVVAILLAAGQLPANIPNTLNATLGPKYSMYASYGIAVFCLLLMTCLICTYKKAHRAIDVTMDAITGATEALSAMPTLLLAPVVQVFLRVAWLAYGLYGLAWIISCAQIVTANPMDRLDGPIQVSGLTRHIVFDEATILMACYWTFGIVWIHEIVVAIGQMALSHAVVEYTFFGKKCLPLLRGYRNAFMWHLGTVAFGGFVIGVLRILAMIAGYMHRQTKSGGAKNAVKKAVCCCCLCCLNCLIKIAEMVNEMLYVDVCITGQDYMSACGAVMKLLAQDPDVFGMVAGATAVVKYVGILGLGVGGTYAWHLILINPALADAILGQLGAPTGLLSTSSVLGATIGAGLISMTISSAFMVVFDHTAESQAYCVMWQLENKWPDEEKCKQNRPKHWKELENNRPKETEQLLRKDAGKENPGE